MLAECFSRNYLSKEEWDFDCCIFLLEEEKKVYCNFEKEFALLLTWNAPSERLVSICYPDWGLLCLIFIFLIWFDTSFANRSEAINTDILISVFIVLYFLYRIIFLMIYLLFFCLFYLFLNALFRSFSETSLSDSPFSQSHPASVFIYFIYFFQFGRVVVMVAGCRLYIEAVSGGVIINIRSCRETKRLKWKGLAGRGDLAVSCTSVIFLVRLELSQGFNWNPDFKETLSPSSNPLPNSTPPLLL